MIDLVAPQKDWDEALHPRDEHGRFAVNDESAPQTSMGFSDPIKDSGLALRAITDHLGHDLTGSERQAVLDMIDLYRRNDLELTPERIVTSLRDVEKTNPGMQPPSAEMQEARQRADDEAEMKKLEGVEHTTNPAPDAMKEANTLAAMQALATQGEGLERGVMLDKDGNIIVDEQGHEPSEADKAQHVLGYVEYTQKEMDDARGGVSLHSHPTNWGQSDQDIINAAFNQMQASIVVHDDHGWLVAPKYLDSNGMPDWHLDDLKHAGPFAQEQAEWDMQRWAGRHEDLIANETNPPSPDSPVQQKFAESFLKHLGELDYLTVRHVRVPAEGARLTAAAPRARKEAGPTVTVKRWAWTPDNFLARRIDLYRMMDEQLAARAAKDFDESKHPRDDRGRFSDVAGGELDVAPGRAGQLTKLLDATGGFTYSPFLLGSPKQGEVLSIHPERDQTITGRKVTMDDLDAFVDRNADLLHEKGNYLGGWKDQGRTILDVVEIVQSRDEAAKLGRQHDQEAFYELQTGTTVRLKEARVRGAAERRDAGGEAGVPRLAQWRRDEAGREAVERLRAQKDMRAILEDDKLWAELRDYATAAALPIFKELYLGGMEAALKLARKAGYRMPAAKDTPDPELQNRLAQRAALDAARLVNDWWNRIDAVTRYELAALLGPAAGEEAALDLGAVTEGVAAIFGPERAQRIAVTETTRAMGQAATATYQELGIDGWEWRTCEDNLVCPICDDMEANNPYSIDDPFEPAHVNCRCWPVPLVEGGKEFDEEKHPRDQAGRFAVVEGSEPFTDDAERKAGREAAHEYYSHYEKPVGANYFIPNPYVSKYAAPDDTTAKWIPAEVPWVGKAAEDPDFQRGVLERTGQWDSPRFGGEHGEQQRQLEGIEQAMEYAQSMRDGWSASPTSDMMIAFQETAAETLGLGPTHDPLTNDERTTVYGDYERRLAGVEEYKKDDAKADAALAKNIYAQTQASLKAAGVKEVTLYRGLSWDRPASDIARAIDPEASKGSMPEWTKDVAAGDRLHIQSEGMNPLSSWSGSSEKADNFARERQYGMIVEMRVPAEKIFSTPQTGFGSSRESEWVVLAHDNDTAKVVKAGPINVVNGQWETPEETKRREAQVAEINARRLVMHNIKGRARIVLDDAANADWLRDGGVKEFDESLHPRDAAGRFADVFGDVATQELAPFTEEEKRERAELALAAHRYENRDPAIDEATGEYQWVMDVAHNMVEQKGIDLALVADRDAHDRDTDFERYAQILAQGARDDWSNSTNDPTTIQFQYDAAKALGIDRAMSPIDPRDIISAQEQDAGLVAQGLKPEETAAEFEKKLDRDYQLKSDTARGRINGAMAKAIYDETQKSLADAGIKEVVLYRGLAWPVEGSEPKWAREAQAGDHMSLPAEGQTPLSSWSSSYYRATQFAQSTPNAVVLSMRVPAKEVFSTHLTGFGSQLEHEWVIKAADNDSVQVVNGFVPVARRDNPAILEIDKAEAVKSVRLKKISVDDQAQNRYWLSKSATKEFNPDQPRDEHGRWTSGGEAGGSVLTAREQANAEKYMHEHHILARTVRDRIERLLKKADPETIAKGKDWYPAARRYAEELSKRYGVSADTIAGVIAATSPQVHWAEVEPGETGWAASNQDQAERVLNILKGDYGKSVTISMDDAAALYAMDHASESKERVKEALDLTNYHGIDETKWGQDFTGTHDVKDLPSDVLAAMHPEAQGLRESLTKAFEIARGKDIDQTLSGLKVRAFYNNITHPESTDVTIDGHEIHALMGRNDLPDQTYAMAINTPGKYEWFEDRVREEAARQGLSPSQLQAISWLAWRDEHPFTERRAVAVAGKDLALDEADPDDPDLWSPEKFYAMVAKDNEFRRRIAAKEWDESKHPRDHGKFTFADSAGGGAPDLMGGIHAVGVPGPTAEHIKNVEALFEHSVKELNIMAGPDGKQVTAEEVKSSLVATAQDIITHSDVAIRIPAGLVDEVLEQGVMNQHATNSTGGLLNPEFRRNVENEAFGIPKDAKYAEFPVYGYLSNPTSERQSNVSGYGDVRLVLKDEVKDRTTYTHGDSLGAIAEDTVQPAPLRHPDALAERQDLIQYTFKPGTPRTWDDPQNYTGNYWETQIHGGVKGEDIARIEYVLNPIEYADATHSIARLNDFDQQAKMAESRGIPVYVQLNPGDMERYASERMQHYEDVVRRELSKDPTR